MKKTKETRSQRIEQLAGIIAYCSQKLTKQEAGKAIASVLIPGNNGGIK